MPDMTEEEKRIRAEAKRRAEEAARRREEQALLDLKQSEMDAKMSGAYKRAQGQSVSGMMRGGSVQKYAKGGSTGRDGRAIRGRTKGRNV